VRAAHRWLVRGVGVAGRGRCRGELVHCRGGACQGSGVGVDLQSSFLVATRGGKRQSSSGGAPFPSAGHGAEQEAAPAAPAFPRRPGDGHTPFNAQVAIFPQLPISQVSPSFSSAAAVGGIWGESPLAAAGRARARDGRAFIQAN
jgi:hypothetical protein